MQPVKPHAPGDESRFAENNAPFIFNCLEKLCSGLPAKRCDFTYKENPMWTIPESRGIYMFYADFGKEGKYPVYIGKSEQGFRTRFARHAIDGVIWSFDNHQFPRFQFPNNPKLGAVLLVFQSSIGFSLKLTESLFLYPFDFALNKAENDAKRLQINEIILNSPRVSYDSYFQHILNALRGEAEKLDKALRENKPKPELH